MGQKWMRWTVLEGATRTASKTFQKYAGIISTTLAHTFLVTAVIGLVQACLGFCVTKKKNVSLFPNTRDVLGSCVFGFFAFIATVLGIIVFLKGGDMGVNTFIVVLSIIPGAFIDRFIFKRTISRRKWVGVGVAILAGYSVLGWPSLTEAASFPLWVWLSFGMMFSVAINQGVTQKVKDVDPMVKNFWGGLTTITCCVIGSTVVGELGVFGDFSPQMQKLWLVSAVIGGFVVLLWTFNLLSYRDGASIVLKKVVMSGTYLTLTMILGAILFGESFGASKVVGICLYFVAFVFVDEGTWNYLKSLFKARAEAVEA